MKTCPSCSRTKPIEAFAPNRSRSDGRQAQCRDCYAAYQRDDYGRRTAKDPEFQVRHRRLRRERQERRRLINRGHLWKYLASHPCVDCGEKDPIVLEFDHTDPNEKSFSIADAIFWKPWDEIQRELAKCEVRCANCHRRRTATQRGFYSYLGDGA